MQQEQAGPRLRPADDPAAVVESIGHAVIDTPDVERLLAHYTEVIGMSVVDRGEGAVYLSCPDDHHSLLIRKGEAGCRGLALQLGAGADLGEAAKRLEARGVKVDRRSDAQPGIAEELTLTDPNGTTVTLFGRRPSPGRSPSGKGIQPMKIGHIAFNSVDANAVTDFYVDNLGFRVSDWFADFFSFLRCGPDHHTVNFLGTGKVKLNHVAYQLRDITHLQETCDLLGKRDIRLIWGPGRHGPGHNVFTYHPDPDGNVIELFTQLDIMSDEAKGFFDPRPWHSDNPQFPKVWEPHWRAADLWGSDVPPVMMGAEE